MRKVAVFVLCLIPAAWLVIAALTDRLSADPIKDITEDTGTWALRRAIGGSNFGNKPARSRHVAIEVQP